MNIPAELVTVTREDRQAGKRAYDAILSDSKITLQDAYIKLAALNAALERGIRERNRAIQRDSAFYEFNSGVNRI
jgi:hypothetical protein